MARKNDTKSDYRSDISEAIHSSAAMLHKVGAIDAKTMRDFDARHLTVSQTTRPPGTPADS